MAVTMGKERQRKEATQEGRKQRATVQDTCLAESSSHLFYSEFISFQTLSSREKRITVK